MENSQINNANNLSRIFGPKRVIRNTENENRDSVTQDYVNYGRNELDTIKNNINSLLGGPSSIGNNRAIFDELSGGYEMSPAAQSRRNELLRYNHNAHATQGTVGGQYHRMDDLNGINDLINQDQQQYFNNRLGLYNTGLGLSQGLSGMGLQGLNTQIAQQNMDLMKRQYQDEYDAAHPSLGKAALSYLVSNSILGSGGGGMAAALRGSNNNSIGKVSGGNDNSNNMQQMMALAKMLAM